MCETGRLPIYEIEHALISALHAEPRVIVQAPTGSGKSTQVPQILCDRGLAAEGQIVVLEPRRLAARMLAAWVARERGCVLGGEVGYQVRFENRSGTGTRIKYETDGILLRRLVSDPTLGGVGAIVFDEFHERHLYTDVMLGRALQLQRSIRPDLKLVVMSATLDSGARTGFLSSWPVLEAAGRMYPIALAYLPRAVRFDKTPVWEVAAREFERAAAGGPDGDVLVFMPGAYEIRRTIEAIRRTGAGKRFAVMPLHGDLPSAEQDAAVMPCAQRKVVVATNVAETSLTIPGVTLVVDSGLARKARFDPHRGINTLLIEKISQASAEQRTGRAGRTRAGRCIRLWTEREHRARPVRETPEVQRVDMAEITLLLKACGIGDVGGFPWVDAPDANALAGAIELLQSLGALDMREEAITALGRQLLAFPAHPRYARMLVAAEYYGCVPTAALIAALTQERNLLLRHAPRAVRARREDVFGEETDSDLFVLMRAWHYAREQRFSVGACAELGIHAQAARRIARIHEQFLEIARGQGLDMFEQAPSSAAIRRCILAGFSDQLARRRSAAAARYELVRGRRGTLDKNSVVRERALVVAAEVQEIGTSRGEVEVRLGLVTAVEQDWLREMLPGAFSERREVRFDTSAKRVAARWHIAFRDLVLETRHAGEPTPEEAASVLAREVHEGRLVLRQWDRSVEQWIARLNGLAGWCPELGLPPITDTDRLALLEQICHGAVSYKQLKNTPVRSIVRSWLSGAQQAMLEKLVPDRVTLSNGRTPKVVYEEGKQPYISLRVQELYDVTDLPQIALGNVKLLVHILAPNQRPVQITDDLRSFWQSGYEEVKKQLKGRYPKHEWR